MNRMLYCTARLLWKLKADNHRWAKTTPLAVFLGIYTAEMIVMLPDVQDAGLPGADLLQEMRRVVGGDRGAWLKTG